MDEVVVYGVVYVRLYGSPAPAAGDPSGFWDNFDEKEREEIRRRMIKSLVEAGYFMRKDDYKKANSIYEKDELFYGL
jgi:hypothetical protein